MMEKSADAYRTISEVAEDLKLPQHVLRFWETRFPQIKPMKRGGGRRFYGPSDVELLRAIRTLLYGEGYTIKGVQRILGEQGPRAVSRLAQSGERPEPEAGFELVEAQMRAGADSGQARIHQTQIHQNQVHQTEVQEGDFGFDLEVEMIFSDREAPPPDPAGRDEPRACVEPEVLRPDPTMSLETIIDRLHAILFEVSECERLLRAARS